MITIIHGDDTVSSRNFFYTLRQKSQNYHNFDNENFDLNAFLQSVQGKSLFSQEKNIFLDNIFTSKKISQSEQEKIISLIKKNDSPIDIFIWEGSDLTRTFINQFPKADIKLFKIPKNIFAFLDSIRPKRNENVTDFRKALETSDEEAIFYMLIRQFRLLIGIDSLIDEVKRLENWQINKFKKQASFFTQEQLITAYDKLYEIDSNIKTGVYPNLTRAIDIFLLDL